MDKCCVFFELGTEFLNVIKKNFCFEELNITSKVNLFCVAEF
jgi:hypothetical protein